MSSTRRSRGSGAQALAHLGLLLAACFAVALFSLAVLGGDRVQAHPPNPPHGDGVHPGGGNGGLDNSGHGFHQDPPPPPPQPDPPPPEPPPADPPAEPPPADLPPDNGPVDTGAGPQPSSPTPTALSGVAGVTASGHAPRRVQWWIRCERDRAAPHEPRRQGRPSQGPPTEAGQGAPGWTVARYRSRPRPHRQPQALEPGRQASLADPDRPLGQESCRGRAAHPLADRAPLPAGDDLQQGD